MLYPHRDDSDLLGFDVISPCSSLFYLSGYFPGDSGTTVKTLGSSVNHSASVCFIFKGLGFVRHYLSIYSFLLAIISAIIGM